MEPAQNLLAFSPMIGAAGFLFAIMTYMWILKQPAGNAKMIGIATLIEDGSMTFLNILQCSLKLLPVPVSKPYPVRA